MKKPGKRTVERWFDQQGLPAFAVGARPLTASSTLPPLVLLSSWNLLDSAVDALRGSAVLLQLFALVASILLPAALTWRTVRFLKKPRSRHLYAMISTAVLVAVLVAARGLGDVTSDDFIGSLAVNLVIAAVLTGLSYLRVGAILAWSVRESLRQSKALREMTGRALPLFVLLTVFGFLAAEVWQFTAALTPSQFWTVVAILLTATLYFSATISFTEMKDIVRSDYVQEAEAGTLAATVSAEHFTNFSAEVPRRRVTRPARLNIVAKLALAQTFQACLFSLVVFVFFVIFGVAAVGDDVITSWIGHQPTPAIISGVPLLVDDELLRSAGFIAALSTVYFAASTSSEPRYRAAFYDPLSHSISVSLYVRDRYLALHDRRP